MGKSQIIEEIHKMRFEEIYGNYRQDRLGCEEAVEILGISVRTFYRKRCRYESEDFNGSFGQRIVRRSPHRAFKNFARRGKTSSGWFFGFKVHLILNNDGEIMSFQISSGNTDHSKPVNSITKNLKGWIFGDVVNISKKLTHFLEKRGFELITTLKHTMKKQLLTPLKKYLLNKRGMVETIIDQLKNMLHIHLRGIDLSLTSMSTYWLASLLMSSSPIKSPFPSKDCLLTELFRRTEVFLKFLVYKNKHGV